MLLARPNTSRRKNNNWNVDVQSHTDISFGSSHNVYWIRYRWDGIETIATHLYGNKHPYNTCPSKISSFKGNISPVFFFFLKCCRPIIHICTVTHNNCHTGRITNRWCCIYTSHGRVGRSQGSFTLILHGSVAHIMSLWFDSVLIPNIDITRTISKAMETATFQSKQLKVTIKEIKRFVFTSSGPTWI